MKIHLVLLFGLLLAGCKPQPEQEQFPVPRYTFQAEVLRKTPYGDEVAVCFKFDPVTGRTWCAPTLGLNQPVWREIKDSQDVSNLVSATP